MQSQCSGDLKQMINEVHLYIKALTEPEENFNFSLSHTSVVMTAIAGMGFIINVAAALFLTFKLKKHYSPFLR